MVAETDTHPSKKKKPTCHWELEWNLNLKCRTHYRELFWVENKSNIKIVNWNLEHFTLQSWVVDYVWFLLSSISIIVNIRGSEKAFWKNKMTASASRNLRGNIWVLLLTKPPPKLYMCSIRVVLELQQLGSEFLLSIWFLSELYSIFQHFCANHCTNPLSQSQLLCKSLHSGILQSLCESS